MKENDTKKCWCGSDLGNSVHSNYGTCKYCGTLVLLKQFDRSTLESFYKDSYWTTYMKTVYNKPTIQERAINDFYDRIPLYYEILKKYKPQLDSLLEIGCSHGGFLYYCQKQGIRSVVGIEVDAQICEYAKNNFGLNQVISGMFPDTPLPLDEFNCIACFDVLEHFCDPLWVCKTMYHKLSNEGICFFVTPSYRGEEKDWDRFRVDEHLYLYNENSACLLLHKANIAVVDIYPSLYSQDMIIIGKKTFSPSRTFITSHIAIPFHDYGINAYPHSEYCSEMSQVSMAQSLPLISVICLIEKKNDLWKKCLRSVIYQNYPFIELVVLYTKQSDEIRYFCDEFKDSLPAVYQSFSANTPLSVRLNTGISLAHGQYVVYMTEQCAYYSNHLLVLAQNLMNTTFDVVYSDVYRAGQILINGQFVTLKRDVVLPNVFDRTLLFHEPPFPLFSSLITKTLIEKMGGYDENFNYCCDWDFWIRYADRYSGTEKKLSQITHEYFFRNEPSIVSETMRIQYMNERQMLFDKHGITTNFETQPLQKQNQRMLIDRHFVYPIPTIQVFMDSVLQLVEQNKIVEMVRYYSRYRTCLPPVAELNKFDSIIKTFLEKQTMKKSMNR